MLAWAIAESVWCAVLVVLLLELGEQYQSE